MIVVATAIVASVAVSIPIATASSTSKGAPPSIAVRPSVAVVPEGRVLRVSESNASGVVVGRYVVDPARRVVVYEDLGGISVAPFAALGVCDDSGRSEVCGSTLEVFETSVKYEQAVARLDNLAGRTMRQMGTKRIAGVLTDVVEGTKNVPGDDGSATLHITGFVDPDSGLVVREEITDGSRTRVVQREFIDRSDEEYGGLVRSDVTRLAEQLRRQRIEGLETSDHPIYALKNGAQGLSLLWVMVSTDGDWCRLEYQSVSAPGCPAASVTSWDLAEYPDYPSDMLQTLSQARIDDDAEIQRVSFRLGDTAVQVQVEKPCMPDVEVIDLASLLVVSSAAGLE